MRTVALLVALSLAGCSSLSDRLFPSSGPFDKSVEPVRGVEAAPPPPAPRPRPVKYPATRKAERVPCNPCMTDQCRRECSLDNPERKRHLYCIQMCAPPSVAPEYRETPPAAAPVPRDPSWPTPPRTTCKFGEFCQ